MNNKRSEDEYQDFIEKSSETAIIKYGIGRIIIGETGSILNLAYRKLVRYNQGTITILYLCVCSDKNK
ncbi:hypothetical protein J5TS2_27070 [Brevibacillus halotolerans]|nr:hypothetical protein J5TS2_27070 [Brevibacillus halotolerans]